LGFEYDYVRILRINPVNSGKKLTRLKQKISAQFPMFDSTSWNTIIATLPNPQLLQTREWGEVKARFGWQAHHKVWKDDGGNIQAAALVLERSINLRGMALRLRMHYTPKGPLLRDWSDVALRTRVLSDLVSFARERGAFLLKIDPDVPVGRGVPGGENAEEGLVGVKLIKQIEGSGWHFSNEQVQFRNTVLVDLRPPEEDLLARMKQKTRYNVRLAGRKGVTVRQGGREDFERLYQMYAETAVRDGFAIRGWDYYHTVWNTFLDTGILTPLIAEVEEEMVSGLMLFHFGGMAWYLYGMSQPAHREKMPTYLLQWEAMRAAKAMGCTVYDLWGAPDVFEESDSLWGVYRFKSGLGGQVVRHIGAWDLPLRPWIYRLYAQVWPRIMDTLRWCGRSSTRADTRQFQDG
jgi:lipid II:glycine glycyltransferase (peptidoglycan interpeptide bridge formation enzyme)